MNMPATYVQYMSNSWSDTQALDRWTLISPVFATVVRIFRASNDVGPLFLGPGSTRNLFLGPGSTRIVFVFVWTQDPEIEALHCY